MGVKGMPGVDPQTTGQHQPAAHQAKGDPWPWPQSADAVLEVEREAVAGSGQLSSPHSEAIDRAAYDRFMQTMG